MVVSLGVARILSIFQHGTLTTHVLNAAWHHVGPWMLEEPLHGVAFSSTCNGVNVKLRISFGQLPQWQAKQDSSDCLVRDDVGNDFQCNFWRGSNVTNNFRTASFARCRQVLHMLMTGWLFGT